MQQPNKRMIGLIVFALFLSVQAIQGQRVGGAAQGGSVRPERVQTEEKISQTPLTTAITPTATPFPDGEDCDPNTVDGTCPGTFSFTYGFSAGASPRSGGNSSIRAGFSFAAYVTKRVFVVLDNDNVISNKDSMGERTTGFGDTSIYAGADIFLEKTKTPSLTVLYGIKAPTASVSKGIGSGEVDHTILGAVGKTFGTNRKTYLEFDVGNSFAGKQDSGGFDSYPFAALFLRQKLDKNKKFTLHLELGGTFRASGYEGDMYNLSYLETQVTPSTALRVGGRFGITDNVSRAGLYVGIKFNGNLKKAFK